MEILTFDLIFISLIIMRMKKGKKVHLEWAKAYWPQDYEVVDEMKILEEENKKLKEENEKLKYNNKLYKERIDEIQIAYMEFEEATDEKYKAFRKAYWDLDQVIMNR